MLTRLRHLLGAIQCGRKVASYNWRLPYIMLKKENARCCAPSVLGRLKAAVSSIKGINLWQNGSA